MGNAAPRLTVGMPVYNGEAYLAQAIKSILDQTYSDFEFIISDNASTDSTEEICRAYAARDSRIVYSRLDENLGAARNFNQVFLMGRSPYFKFAAADDLCAPRFFEACMSTYASAPDDVVLCFPRTIRIDGDGNPEGVIEERMDIRESRPHARLRYFLHNYRLANCFYGVLRAPAYRSTRLHRAYDAADIVLLGELALRGQFWQIDEALFFRRVHAAMSHKANPTAADIRQFYDTGRRGKRAFPKTRMSWEFWRAIDTTDIAKAERMRCRRELGRIWFRKYWKTIAREAAEGVGIPVSRFRRKSHPTLPLKSAQ